MNVKYIFADVGMVEHYNKNDMGHFIEKEFDDYTKNNACMKKSISENIEKAQNTIKELQELIALHNKKYDDVESENKIIFVKNVFSIYFSFYPYRTLLDNIAFATPDNGVRKVKAKIMVDLLKKDIMSDERLAKVFSTLNFDPFKFDITDDGKIVFTFE